MDTEFTVTGAIRTLCWRRSLTRIKTESWTNPNNTVSGVRRGRGYPLSFRNLIPGEDDYLMLSEGHTHKVIHVSTGRSRRRVQVRYTVRNSDRQQQ